MNRIKKARCTCNEPFWCDHIISTLLIFSCPNKNKGLHLDHWKKNIEKMERKELENLIFNMISNNPKAITNLSDGISFSIGKKKIKK